ncbi:MAG: ABC transporter substrate-binding protein [Streptosporangiaceae bacterium]
MKIRYRSGVAVAATFSAVALLCSACGSSTSSASSGGHSAVNIGLVTTSSGAAAELGTQFIDGASLAVRDLNKSGGVLGHHVNLITKDNGGSVSTSVSEVRQMVSSSSIQALLGPDSSSAGVAEASVIRTEKIPYILMGSNDIAQTTQVYTPYTVQIVPNTIMEPNAVAQYVATQMGKGPLRVALVAPDYNFGLDTVGTFVSALKARGVKFTIVQKALPSPTATSFAQYLPGLVRSKPDVIFAAMFGAQLTSFTKEASAAGLLKNATIISYYGSQAMQQLGSTIPAKAVGLDRAPFWAIPGPGAQAMVQRFKATYHQWPGQYAIYGYAAVQTWAQGVKSAHSFTASQVVNALADHDVTTVLGSYPIRGCDHQELTPEFLGAVSPTVSAKYGLRIYSKTVQIPGSATDISCSQSLKLRTP